jgi:hypothetical protein
MIRFSLTTAAAVVLAVTLYVAGAVTSPPIALAGPTQCAEQGEAGCARESSDDADADNTDGPQNTEDGGQVGGEISSGDTDQTEGNQGK